MKIIILDFLSGMCSVLPIPDDKDAEEYMTQKGYDVSNCEYMVTEHPIRNDELTTRAHLLLDAIDNNTTDLWNPDLQNTTSCVVYHESDIGFEVSDKNGDLVEKEISFNGIHKEYSNLLKAVRGGN